VYSDAAKRISSSVNLHAFAGQAGKWASFALQDGRTDNVAYDTRREAVRFKNWDRDRFVYILIPPDGMGPREAEAALKYARALHDAGYRLPDPELIDSMPTMPALPSDKKLQIEYLTK
jgi:hypothetical protein